ncbi:MAG: alpha/beta fold hydrolase [Anaerolineae bacterium]
MMRQLRNFVLRLSIHYIVLYILLALQGVSHEQRLFGVWIVAIVFSILTVTVRRVLLTVTLPLIIMTGGLFIFIVDGIVLVLTAALTGLNVASFGAALLGVFVMSNANIWIERAFRAIGWLRDDERTGVENVMMRRSPPWWLRLILFAILIFGVGFSAAMASQLFLTMTKVTAQLPIALTVADAAFILITLGIAWLIAEGLALERQARFSVLATLAATLLVALPVTVLIFTEKPVQLQATPEPRPETAYWELPTGSRIAYSHFAAPDSDRNPIVVLHGGPGWGVRDSDIAFFPRFSEGGFDVYLYDQVGCGLSGRLEKIADYTISRHTEDLEEIRETIRADRLILVAHEAGAEIAVRYMVEHRDRVEAVIFYSPTSLWDDEEFISDETRTAAWPIDPTRTIEFAVRPTVALAIAYHSPKTAQAYVPQTEMIAWGNRIFNMEAMVCVGDEELVPESETPGYNPYVEIVGQVTANRPPDPRPSLHNLFIPTILLRGACDSVDPAVVDQYLDAIPYLQVQRIEGAGSMLHLSQPGLVEAIILEFLTGGALR